MRIKGGVSVLCTLFLLGSCGQALASGITNSGDDLRTGWYPNESSITPELIEGGTFGQEWSTKVEGQVYAQPLLYNGTLLVATEKNRIYGLDPASGAPKWSATLPQGTSWNPQDVGCADLTPSIGVTATPVIDSSTGTAYLTHKTYASGSSGEARWWMDAIEMSTGAEKAGFPVEMGGEAQNLPGLKFNAADELQRPGLLLMEGVVYAGYGSHCDHTPYQGWVFGVSTGGSVRARWATDGVGGGIWQSGAGLSSDGPGRILLSTGNGFDPEPPIVGSKPPEGGLGQAVVRLQVQSNGELRAADFFAPYDANALNKWDADFGSGGVTGLPSPLGEKSTVPHLAVAVGKDGYVYLLNRDSLGGYGEGKNGEDKVVQRIGPRGGVWSRPGVWPGEGGWVYIPTASAGNSAGGSSGQLDIYHYGLSGEGTPLLSLEGSSSDAFGFSSGAPVITSNGTEKGSALVWVVWAPNGSGEGAQLRAYAPVPVNEQAVLLHSWPIGTSAKFSIPGVGLGRMYVGTRDEHVLGFGSPVTPPLTAPRTEFPTTVVGEHSERTVTLTANEPVTIEAPITSSSPQFAVGTPSRSLPAALKAGEQVNVPVTFSPSGAGPQAATLKVTIKGGTTLSFSLSGTGKFAGAKLEATPAVVTFGGTSIGSPISATARIKNVGAEALNLETAAPEAPFSLEEELPSKLEPGQQVVARLKFEPTRNGSFEGAVGLTSNGGSATLHLTGIAAPPGLLSIAPERNEFGQVPVGGEAIRSFGITNTGGLPVKINISKPPIAGDFHAITSLPEGESEVQPGQTVTESVRFTPSVLGASSDVWRITGQDAGGLHEVLFTGEGVPQSPGGGLLTALGGAGVLGFKGSGPVATLAGTSLAVPRTGIVTLRVRCPASESSCLGTITLRALTASRAVAGARPLPMLLATGSFRASGGRVTTVRLHLRSRARVLLARLHVLRARATIYAHDQAGRRHTTTATVTLRATRARH